MDGALNIDKSVTGQPWRWRRARRCGTGDGRSWSTSCCSPAASLAKTSRATATPRSATSSPTRAASRTWTRARAACRRGAQGRDDRDLRRLRRRWRDKRGGAGAASAAPRRRADGLYPRPADGRLWPVGQSAGRTEGAGRDARRLRRLWRAGVRRARRSKDRRARRHCRRSSPMRERCFLRRTR